MTWWIRKNLLRHFLWPRYPASFSELHALWVRAAGSLRNPGISSSFISLSLTGIYLLANFLAWSHTNRFFILTGSSSPRRIWSHWTTSGAYWHMQSVLFASIQLSMTIWLMWNGACRKFTCCGNGSSAQQIARTMFTSSVTCMLSGRLVAPCPYGVPCLSKATMPDSGGFTLHAGIRRSRSLMNWICAASVTTGMYIWSSYGFFLTHFLYSCRKEVKVSTRVTTKLDDSIFYIYSENESPRHRFFKCIASTPSTLSAKALFAGPAEKLSGSTRIKQRPWSRVGVYNYIGVDVTDLVLEIPRVNVTGKAMIVDGFLITLPDPVLQEAWIEFIHNIMRKDHWIKIDQLKEIARNKKC